MSNKKTTIVAEAVLEAQNIMEEAKKFALKELLSEIEPDLDKLVNESLDVDKKVEPVSEDITDDEDETGVDSDVTSDDVVSVEDEPEVDSSDDSPIASALDSMGADSETDVDTTDVVSDPIDGVDSETGLDLSGDVEDDTVDLTGAPIDDVIKVFKEITPEDQIEVVKDENGISLDVKGEKFFIKLNENEEGDDDKLLYELELDEDETLEEEKLDEVSRTHSDGRRQIKRPVGFYNYAQSRLRDDLKESVQPVTKVKEVTHGKPDLTKILKAEKDQLSEELTTHKNTLKELSESLRSMALYNNNLGHAIKLFMEHSTTKAEKQEIIKRFNLVNTVDSSKQLFESISGELKNKKTITESVAEKLDSTLLGASSDKTLVTEAKDDVLTRMQKLISYNTKEN